MPKLKKFKRFLSLTDKQKKILLMALGYGINKGGFIINMKDKKKVHCYYTKEFILFENASILPGSTIIINTTPYTLSKYIEEFLE